MPDESTYVSRSEAKLWDEITKAIIHSMTPRLFPVIKEAYGKEYPPGTPLTLLSTEHSTYLDNPSKTPSSKLMDIAVLVGETDYYHIECQMENDYQMVIRMIAYDLHFSILHCTTENAATGEITLRFQSLLDNKNNILTKETLTDFVERLIVDLKEEVETGVLTEMELRDYINLFEMASQHIFQGYPEFHEEVLKLTEPLIKLPSVQIRELQQIIVQKESTIAQNESIIAQNESIIAQNESTIAQKDAYIAELEQKLAALSQ